MERRDFLNGIGTAGLGLGAAAIAVQKAFVTDAFAAETAKKSPESKKNIKLAEAASVCVGHGQACLQHCIDMMSTGDTSMAACAQATYLMTSACATLARLARADSPHLVAMAKITSDICKSCETECRKHSKTMEICGKCADACATCAKLCDQVGA